MAVLLLLAIVAWPVNKANAKPRTVDLIPLIDVDKDAVSGTWTLDHGAIVSDESDWARLRIPYEPPDEYDFRIEFIANFGQR